ncbi:MAG: hypothetical protein ACLQVD_02040 [Capsulimonadaceae bacterium]
MGNEPENGTFCRDTMVNMIGVMFGLAFSAVYDSGSHYFLETATLNPTAVEKLTTVFAIMTFLAVCSDFFIGTQQTANHHAGSKMDRSFMWDLFSTVLSLLGITVAGACVGARTEPAFMWTLFSLYFWQVIWAGARVYYGEQRTDQADYQWTDIVAATLFLFLAVVSTWTDCAKPLMVFAAFILEVGILVQLAERRSRH